MPASFADADDFVILSRGHAAEALAWTKAVMTKLGLTTGFACDRPGRLEGRWSVKFGLFTIVPWHESQTLRIAPQKRRASTPAA